MREVHLHTLPALPGCGGHQRSKPMGSGMTRISYPHGSSTAPDTNCLRGNCTRTLYRTGLLMAMILLLSGCISILPETPPTPTPIPPTPTATFIFPTQVPTTTHTPEPTATPTPDLLAGLGEVVYSDDFQINRGWDLKETDIGGSSMFGGRINLAVRRPNAFFFIRNPTVELTDFYLELSARIEVCSEGDEYGVMFRLNEIFEHYRFTLTCSGETRITRVLQDGEIALIPSTQTYTVIPGLKVVNRFAVWASGDQFRFFINEQEVFFARDIELQSGGLGLFVRSRRSGQVTVSFDSLTIRSLLPEPTPTYTPMP